MSNTASNVATASDVLATSLATVIQKATAGVEAGVGFLSTQLPDVIQQLLLWTLIKNSLGAVLLMIPITVAIVAAKKANFNKTDDTAAWVTLIFGVVSLFTTPFAFVMTFDAIKVAVAPKLFLIEYAANLLK